MDPKSQHKFVLFFLSIYLTKFLSQTHHNTEATCGKAFQCANIANLTYPFWNKASISMPQYMPPKLCGHPDFGLDCHGAAPILTISQLSYRVLHIDFSNSTIKVARQDLWNNTCSPSWIDTTLNSDHFELLQGSDYRNVTLYYNCSAASSLPSPSNRTLRNQFTCTSIGTTNYFRTRGNASAEFRCRQQIRVPVNESAALALETPAASPRDALRDALAGGFLVHWLANDSQCNECYRLGSKCAYALQWTGRFYDPSRGQFTCDTVSPGPPRQNPRDPPPTPLEGARGAPPRSPTENATTSNPPAVSRSNHGPSSNRTRIRFGLVFGAVGFILAFVLLTWFWKTRYFGDNLTNPNTEKFLAEQGSLILKRYRYYDIKKITKSFNDKLGQGGYGSVYKGTLPNGCPVAVKVLIETDSNDEEFINEVASISRTSHVNIVSLLGFCYERKRRALVYEYMPNKSLDKFISDTSTSLSMEKLYDIAVGVAKGLEYLHRGCSTRIIHFDIKPQNILLDEGFCPKISDFGLAKLCKKRQSVLSMLGTRGTIGYIAPEVFSRNFGGVSHKSDVYSYGIMILEMAGARKFMETETVLSSENYFPDKIYEEAILSHGKKIEIDNKSVVEFEDERARKMFLVGFWCIQTTPSDRPAMSKIVEMLEGSLESIKIPPKPFLFDRKSLIRDFSPSLSVNVEIETSSEDE